MGMMINPPKKSRDQTLFESLQKAHRANLVMVSVKNTDRLNRPGSPVWDPGENAAPLLAMLSVSMVFILTINLVVGTAMMVVSVLAYLCLIRPWILRRVYRRALETALKSINGWENLWNNGGLVISLNNTNRARCNSPNDSWRAFIMRHFPQPKVTSTEMELYASFTKTDDNDDIKAIPELSI